MKRLFALNLLLGVTLVGFAQPTRLKPDEQIIFYPSFAQRVAGKGVWRAEVRGCVFEPEKARVSLAMFREALELKTGEMSPEETAVFKERGRLFLVDHERGKKIFIRLGTNEFFVGKSGPDGMFAGMIEFGSSPERVQNTGDGHIRFSAVLAAGDAREFGGEIFPLDDEGVSVVSDIDDTIKVTDVRNRQEQLRNTFLREFKAAPGMTEFCQAIARTNSATFHYVSASPWQLYEPLAQFTRTNGFPAGTFHLKQFRWKDRNFFSLFADPMKYKLGVIEPMMKQFPNRKFIFIGDSGERDPETYGELARRLPGQVAHIYIRDVTGESADSERYRHAFRGVARGDREILPRPVE